jgi:hypothetical protein
MEKRKKEGKEVVKLNLGNSEVTGLNGSRERATLKTR